MINVFRLHQRKLMLVIAILTIVAFIWLYNPMDMNELGANNAYTLYGRDISQADVQREANKYGLAVELQQLGFIRALTGLAQTEEQMLNEFVWNLFVLQHESHAMGVNPTDTQIADRIRSLPVFQTNGQFDVSKYGRFVEEKLGPRGFSPPKIDEVMRDAIRAEFLQEMVGASVAVSEGEVLEAARISQKIDAETVTFTSEVAGGEVTPTAEEIKTFFEQYQSSPFMMAPETRVVEMVEFALPADFKPADKKASVEALQKLADAATKLVDQAGTSSFAEAAEAAGLNVVTTPAFDRSGGVRSGESVADLPKIAPSVFLLSDDARISDPIQVGEKFYVVRLVTVNPQRGLTLEEASPLIEAQLRRSKTTELVQKNATESVEKIRAAMAGGKTFSEAATEIGLKVESLTGVSPSTSTPAQRGIMRAALLMEPGQVSGFLPSMEGGSVVHLVSRADLDPTELAKMKDEMAPELLEAKRQMLFVTWLAAGRDAANIGQVQHNR